MPAREVESYLARLLASTPDSLHPLIQKFQTYYDRKLWHQLTITLKEFLDRPESQEVQVDLFKYFVLDFQKHLDKLRLAEIGVKVSKSIRVNSPTLLPFLISLNQLIPQDEHPQAHSYVLASLARAKLLYGDSLGARADIDLAQSLLDGVDGVERSVHAEYYAVCSDYYKLNPDYALYFRNTLLYLACVDLDTDMDSKLRMDTAKDLCLSALMADSIYNFGELIMHPILDAMLLTEHEWLRNLVYVFNEGDIRKFDALTPLFGKEHILKSNETFLRQKICLMALIEAVFRRKASERTLSFQTIAEETHTPLNEVEHLVMKALSLKLIKGDLDEVESKAVITWVQPRVLSRGQIEALAGSLTAWMEKMQALEDYVAAEQVPVY